VARDGEYKSSAGVWWVVVDDGQQREEVARTSASDELARDPDARRVAVGVFANRVFASCMREVDGQHEGLLALASGLRDLAATLGAADAVARIHDLVTEALGDDGPMLL